MSHMNLRDNGGLHWPKEDVAHLCGIATILFKKILSNERAMNLLCESSFSSRVGAMALRNIVNERVKKNSCWIKHLIIKCPKCNSDRRENTLRHLINTCFNIGANDLTMLLNRADDAKKITLKMVKALKKKGRHVNLSEEKKVMILT